MTAFRNRALPSLAAAALAMSGHVGASETRHYDWLTSGRVSGFHKLTILDDGSREVEFEFQDRGRGPRTEERTQFDAAGAIERIEISGHAYMGAEVAENFRRTGDAASWSSSIEEGATDRAGGAFYLANNGTSEQMAILARALLASDNQRMRLLPSGEAAIRQVAEATVGPDGGQVRATLYAIDGLDLTPSHVWLDEDLELFALSIYWMALVPQGWAEYLPELQAAQAAAESRHYQSLAGRLGHALGDAWAIRNVNVLDVEEGTLVRGRTVTVRNGRVHSVSEELPGEFEGMVLDGRGGTLLPGLWDMHTHLGMEQGLQHVAAGVTTVRDVGNNAEEVALIRGQFDTGAVIGPRVLAAGFIDRKSPFSAPIGRLVDSLDEALDMVRTYAAAGYPQIKIYSSVDPAWVRPIAEETHRLGLRLSGHVPNGMSAAQAVQDGFDEIQHINMLFLNFLAGPDDDTRTPLRVTLVAERGAALDQDSSEVQEFIGLLARRGTVVDPTVALFDGMFRHRSGRPNPSYAMVADHFPPMVRRSTLGAIMEVSEEDAASYAAGADAMLDMIGRLHEAGVRIVAGTDAMPGFLYHRELELYRQAGIPAADVLRLATLGAAEIMGMADEHGSIAPGKHADMLLLPGDPLQDISAVRTARRVFRGDRYYVPAELHRAMGIKPFVDGP